MSRCRKSISMVDKQSKTFTDSCFVGLHSTRFTQIYTQCHGLAILLVMFKSSMHFHETVT